MGTWVVTHASPEGPRRAASKAANQMYLAVAVTGPKATSKVHLATGLPYEELHTTLVRRDEVALPPDEWNPALERCLGPVEEFRPRTCPTCKGRGSAKIWDGPDYEWKTCPLCNGSGVKPRRPRPSS